MRKGYFVICNDVFGSIFMEPLPINVAGLMYIFCKPNWTVKLIHLMFLSRLIFVTRLYVRLSEANKSKRDIIA